MKSEICYITRSEIEVIKNTIQINSAIFVAEIHGITIQSLDDYFKAVSEIFEFPVPAQGYAGYQDWMRDLDWLDKEAYIIIIYDFKRFMEMDLLNKNKIITDFEKIILPWWQEEVEKYEVEGHTKPFTVYLVD